MVTKDQVEKILKEWMLFCEKEGYKSSNPIRDFLENYCPTMKLNVDYCDKCKADSYYTCWVYSEEFHKDLIRSNIAFIRLASGQSSPNINLEISHEKIDDFNLLCDLIKDGKMSCPFMKNSENKSLQRILLEYNPDNVPKWCSPYLLEQTLYAQKEIKPEEESEQ